MIAGEVEQIGDQLVQLAGLLPSRPDEGGGLRVGQPGAVLEQVEVRSEDGQRRAQFVRRVGQQLALRAHRIVQCSQHGVERRAEPTHLVGTGGADAGGEIAGPGHALGGRGELGDRAEDVARRQPGHAVSDRGGGDGEPGQQQGRLARRAIVGIRRPASTDQRAARGVRHSRRVDAKPLPTVVRLGEVGRLGVLGDRDIVTAERPEPGRLTGTDRTGKQLHLDAADGDRHTDVRRRALIARRLFDAPGDRGRLLGGIDQSGVHPGMQADCIRQIQHAAHRGHHDQHTDRGRD